MFDKSTQLLVSMTCGDRYISELYNSLLFQLLKLRFSEDLRVNEVRRLLQSSRSVRISLTQRPEVR